MKKKDLRAYDPYKYDMETEIKQYYITQSALQELAEREQNVRKEEDKIKAAKARIRRAWNVAAEQSKLNDDFHRDLIEYSQELQEWQEELETEEKRNDVHFLINLFLTGVVTVGMVINMVLLWGFLG